MPTTYAQKQAPAQKKDANSAASVVDCSSQAQSLQRKSDLFNSPIQCYEMDDGFREKHSYCSASEAKERCLNRKQKNSVLTKGAQSKLNQANVPNVKRIVGANCTTWVYKYNYYNGMAEAQKNGEKYCAVAFENGKMHHLEGSGSKMVGSETGWINYKDLP